MNVIRLSDFVLVVACLALLARGTAQERFESGPYKGFLREEPELNKVELPEPLRVSVVRGKVTDLEGTPLPGAAFEIRDSSGHVFSTVTDDAGAFKIPSVRTGTYFFKVTKNQFQSVVGKIIVSMRARQRQDIHIQLQVGT